MHVLCRFLCFVADGLVSSEFLFLVATTRGSARGFSCLERPRRLALEIALARTCPAALRDGEHMPALCRLPAAAADGKWGALPSRDLSFFLLSSPGSGTVLSRPWMKPERAQPRRCWNWRKDSRRCWNWKHALRMFSALLSDSRWFGPAQLWTADSRAG